MKNATPNGFSRRDFLKTTPLTAAAIAGASAVLTTHATPDDPIRIGLIGCRGGGPCSRAEGAVANAMDAAGKNAKVVAIADVLAEDVESSRRTLEGRGQVNPAFPNITPSVHTPDDWKVDPSFCFSGWDAYKKLLAIPEINYVIIEAYHHFRPEYLRAAIEAGKHCFIDRTPAVDVPGCRSLIETGKLAREKGLGILAGTQRRHSRNYQETIKRLQDGAIGKITSARAYWMQGSASLPFTRRPEWSDMEYQLRNWYYYNWLSGDIILGNHLHNLDVINWVLGEHPVSAIGIGGRAVRTGPEFGNIYDHFTVEYKYHSGVRLSSMCCEIDGIQGRIGELVVGELGESNCMREIKGTNAFRYTEKFTNPYQQEHGDFIESIRAGQPLNEAQQIAESTLTAILGREAAYTGKEVDWDGLLESETRLGPAKYEFGPLPVTPPPNPGSAMPI